MADCSQKSLFSLFWTPQVTGSVALTFLKYQTPAPIPMAPAAETPVTVPENNIWKTDRKLKNTLIYLSFQSIAREVQVLKTHELSIQQNICLPAITPALLCPEISWSASKSNQLINYFIRWQKNFIICKIKLVQRCNN